MPGYSMSDNERRRQIYMRSRQDAVRMTDTSTHRIYELIRAGLRDGSISETDQLSEHRLVEQYGSSRNSVRRALRMLADQGLVNRERRTGTNLAHEFVPIPAGEIGPRAWTGTAHEGRLDVSTLCCDTLPVSPELRKRLDCGERQIIVLEQVGSLDATPLYFRIGYNVAESSPDMFMRQIECCHVDYPPLATVFERLFETGFGSSTYAIEAVAASERVGQELNVPPGSPTLLRQLTTYDSEHRPRELSFTYFRSGGAILSGEMVAEPA